MFTGVSPLVHTFSLLRDESGDDLTDRERKAPMTSRVDLHCHSTASQLSRLGVQRSLGLPECATPPHEVYELAKRRGMDFVTITDHDTIDGCLELADRPDCFVSEELTARFAGEAQAVHVLCFGIDPGDHEWLQANAGDVEACAAYLHENEIASALLCRPDADHLAGAVLQLASSPALRQRLGEAAIGAARSRSWERALEQLASGYRRTLADLAATRQAPSRAA